jgi:hypothetical protein
MWSLLFALARYRLGLSTADVVEVLGEPLVVSPSVGGAVLQWTGSKVVFVHEMVYCMELQCHLYVPLYEGMAIHGSAARIREKFGRSGNEEELVEGLEIWSEFEKKSIATVLTKSSRETFDEALFTLIPKCTENEIRAMFGRPPKEGS